MEQIIIKQVMDTDGSFLHLELHQGTNVITLSLASTELDNQHPLWKWDNLVETVDRMKAEIAAANDRRLTSLFDRFRGDNDTQTIH